MFAPVTWSPVKSDRPGARKEPRGLAAALRESVGSGSGAVEPSLVTKMAARGPASGEKKTRAGASNNPLRVEIGHGSKNATCARARQQPSPAGEGLPNP
jgi:hypothetical protein